MRLALPLELAPDDEPPPPYQPPPVVAVYGDSFAAGTGRHGSAEPGWGWPDLLAQLLGVTVVNNAIGGTGYRRVWNDSSFPYAATVWPVPGAALVIVCGTLNDAGHEPEAVRQGAVITYAAIRAANPTAPILAVGPTWNHLPPTPGVRAAREAIANASAGPTVVLHVDSSRWFEGRPDLILPDGIHPNRDGHAHLAAHIGAYVALILGCDS